MGKKRAKPKPSNAGDRDAKLKRSRRKRRGVMYVSCLCRSEDGGSLRKIYVVDYVDRGKDGYDELRALSDGQRLLCEDCGEQMVLYWAWPKACVRPHLQHKSEIPDDHPVRPPKGPLHEAAQTYLRRLLRNQLPGVVVEEEYILHSQKWPDVFVGLEQVSQGQLVDLDIEIQCSDEQQIDARAAELETDDLRSRWIFGARDLSRLRERGAFQEDGARQRRALAVHPGDSWTRSAFLRHL